MQGRWGLYGLMALVAAAGCGGTASTEETTTEQAVLNANGLKWNGLKWNGLKFNGLKFNGLKFNGMGLGGLAITGSDGASISNVTIDKTTLKGRLPTGQNIAGSQFTGATLVGMLEDGSIATVGIKSVHTTSDPEILHYMLQVWNAANSTWVNACENNGKAIPVLGLWQPNGAKVASTTDFTFACLDIGAIAKCVQMGYKPWQYDLHHQSCVRMVRGDYCGTGQGYTSDGNTINVFDKIGKQADDHNAYPNYLWYFDAEWGPNGAVCITSTATRPGGGGIPCITEKFGNGGFCNKSTTTFQSGVYVKNYWGQKLF